MYEFDNTDSVKELSEKAVKRLLFKENTDSHEGQVKQDNDLCVALSFILKVMVLSGALNLRGLLKIHNGNLITISERKINLDDNTSVNNNQLSIVKLLEILAQIIGNAQDLRIAFSKCEQYESIYQSKSISKEAALGSLAALMGYKKGRSGDSNKIKISKTLEVSYKIEYYDSYNITAKIECDPDTLSNVNIFSIYIEGIDYLVNLGFFHR